MEVKVALLKPYCWRYTLFVENFALIFYIFKNHPVTIKENMISK